MPKLSKLRLFFFFALTLLFILLFYIYRQSIFFEYTYKLPFSPYNPTKIIQASKQVGLPESDCDLSIWQHVYLPSRLLIIQPCVAVEGVIGRVDLESDGDNHIYFKPDKNNPNLLNAFNQILAGGNIIAEVVCLHNEKLDEYAQKSCEDYNNKIIVPKKGAHVKMLGSLVLDKDVGWAEIHPVTSIEVEN